MFMILWVYVRVCAFVQVCTVHVKYSFHFFGWQMAQWKISDFGWDFGFSPLRKSRHKANPNLQHELKLMFTVLIRYKKYPRNTSRENCTLQSKYKWIAQCQLSASKYDHYKVRKGKHEINRVALGLKSRFTSLRGDVARTTSEGHEYAFKEPASRRTVFYATCK